MKRIVILFALALAALTSSSAFAASEDYRAGMSGALEAVPNPSPGYGLATVILDADAKTLRLRLPFDDLLGDTVSAHIHCCTVDAFGGAAGRATPNLPDFPTGVKNGLYEYNFSLADPAFFGPEFLAATGGTAASAASVLMDGLLLHEAYINIHSTLYPDGEIRGFLVASPAPEPVTWLMMALGLGAVALYRRKRG
jgi:hypothetical protein